MDDEYVGSICLFGFPFTPLYFLPCDGSLQQISQYPALYSLVGTRYGGDGKTTFALPNLASPDGYMSYCICCDGLYPSQDDKTKEGEDR